MPSILDPRQVTPGVLDGLLGRPPQQRELSDAEVGVNSVLDKPGAQDPAYAPELEPLYAALREQPDTVQRGTVLPFRVDKQNQTHLAVPNILMDSARGVLDLIAGTHTGVVTPEATMALLGLPNAIPGRVPEGALSAIKAFHGSPHTFDKFSMEKVGTGEGSQAYGHGLYFAENPETARYYQEALAKEPDILVNGEPIPPGHDLHSTALLELSKPGTTATNAQILRNQIEHFHNNRAEQIKLNPALANTPIDSMDASYLDRTQKRLAQHEHILNSKVEFGPPGQANMYEVNLAPDPEDLLHWDKPLSEQPAKVQGALRKLGVDPTSARYKNMRGGDFYDESIYSGDYNDPATASKVLQDAGIPGIRYLDAGSRDAGQGSHNVVMFDPEQVQIVKRGGKSILDPTLSAGGAGPEAELAAQAAKGRSVLDLATGPRMERAAEQGFHTKTPLYHATHYDFNQFEPGELLGANVGAKGEKATFLTTEPKVADTYLAHQWLDPQAPAVREALGDLGPSTEPYKHYGEGANVMPVFIKDLNNFDEWQMNGGGYSPDFMRKALKDARKAKRAGVVFKNMADPGMMSLGRPKLSHIVAVFDPKNIRSVHAKFDPAKAGSADLLSAGGAGPEAEVAAQAAKGRSVLDLATGPRMERAAEQGFTQPAYHGSRDVGAITDNLEPFPAKRPPGGAKGDFGIHVALEPETAHNAIIPEMQREGVKKGYVAPADAEWYYYGSKDKPSGSGTLPLLVNPGRSVKLPDFGRWDTHHNAQTKYFDHKTDYGDKIDEYKDSTGWDRTGYASTYTPNEKALAITDNPNVMHDLGDLMAGIERQRGVDSRDFRLVQERTDYPKSADYPDRDAWDKAYDDWKERAKGQLPPKRDERQIWQEGFKAVLDRHGYGSVVYPNEIEGTGGLSMMLVDPKRVRSVHAKFDPAKAGSPDLLASGGAGILGGAGGQAAVGRKRSILDR